MLRFIRNFEHGQTEEISEAEAREQSGYLYEVASAVAPRHIVSVEHQQVVVVSYMETQPSRLVADYHERNYPGVAWRVFSPVSHVDGVDRYTDWSENQRVEHEASPGTARSTWFDQRGVLTSWLERRFHEDGTQIEAVAYDAKTGRTVIED